MAAPTPTARTTPTGAPYKDGYQTLITLSGDPDIEFFEKGVQPPGIEGGDEIEQTTMHNTTWRTFRARSLKTLTEFTVTAAYRHAVFSSILAQINVEQTITVTHPDGITDAFYGYIKSFIPQENTEGEQPMADITFRPTNWDPTNNVEAGPAFGT